MLFLLHAWRCTDDRGFIPFWQVKKEDLSYSFLLFILVYVVFLFLLSLFFFMHKVYLAEAWLMYVQWLPWLPSERRLRSQIAVVDRFANDIIARQRAAHAKAEANAPQREDLISFCMHTLWYYKTHTFMQTDTHAQAHTHAHMPKPTPTPRSARTSFFCISFVCSYIHMHTQHDTITRANRHCLLMYAHPFVLSQLDTFTFIHHKRHDRQERAKTASDAFDVRIRHASNLHATKNKSWLTNTVFCLLLSLSLF